MTNLFISPSSSSRLIPSCFASSFVGTYGTFNLYLPTPDCILTSEIGDTVVAVDVPERAEALLWINEMAIDENVLYDVEAFSRPSDNQIPFEEAVDGTTLFSTQNARLYAFRDIFAAAYSSENLLEPTQKAYLIDYPPSPLLPVADEDIDRVRSILSNLEYDKEIGHLVESLSILQMHDDIRFLTGEAEESPIESRHSFHPGSRLAASWIREQMESTGAACELRTFLPGFAPNIICRYQGTSSSDALVLLSAHYDSRGSFGSTRAPGGDDDGSGTTSILSIARAIDKFGITFKSNVELCLFAGEEQGLLGSKAYARELKAENANITLMIQADMLAYRKPGEPPQLGLPVSIGTPEVAQLVSNISSLYSPELEVGFTAACCSDHQSFHEQGFAATQVFERAGPIADPMYHNSGDLSERAGYDFRQLRSIAKVQFATLLHAAGFE